MNKAIFLDKDGTLIKDVFHNVNPELVSLLPGVGKALQALQAANFSLIIVSNQPGVALGYFTEVDLMHATNRLYQLLAVRGVRPAAFYYCPHAAEGTVKPYAHTCNCRKPLPGLLHRAARDFEVALPDSWMVGDILHDMEAGKRAGCRTILIDNGNETDWLMNPYREPDYIVENIEEAASTILKKAMHETPLF